MYGAEFSKIGSLKEVFPYEINFYYSLNINKMKKTIILFVFVLLTNFSLSAQKSLYEALEAHEEGTKFQEYWSVSENSNKEGESFTDGKRYVVTIKMEKLPSGTPCGFSLIKEEKKSSAGGADVLGDYNRHISYPVKAIRHGYTGKGYVAIGDYIFGLDGISKDGVSFKRISSIFIKIGGEKSEGGVKKKLSLKEKLKAAKEKLTYAYGPEHKKACQTDLKKLIGDYLTEMKSKEDAHTLTAKEKATIAEVKFARENKDASIKAYNDSIKATPEYQKMLSDRKWRKGNINVEVKNRSSHTFWVGSSENAFIVTK
ncbi:MAG: hypothetical protein ACI81T_002676 [Bacteroidia bacterium]|jgi:hypothetical protein